MKIINHRVEGSIPAPIMGGEPFRPLCLVIHFTGGASAQSSVDAMKERKVSAHVVVDRDGTILQCRPFNLTCGHAGKASRWKSPSGKIFSGMNSYSIGIEVANAGSDPGAMKWARKQPGFRSRMAKHRNGGKIVEWEEFPDAQLKAVFALTAALMAEYNLIDITGHDCIAPERKDDPGPCFPMQALRESCHLTGLPAVHWPS